MTDDDDYESFPVEPRPEDICPTCKGSGTINPLTAPPGFFCAVPTTCPDCDGTGEMP